MRYTNRQPLPSLIFRLICDCSAVSSEYSQIIGRHKKRLSEMFQPDFGLLRHLLSRGVITDRNHEHVRAGESVYDRSDRLLHCLSSAALSETQYLELLSALEHTEQMHVANYIRSDGGSSLKICRASGSNAALETAII